MKWLVLDAFLILKFHWLVGVVVINFSLPTANIQWTYQPFLNLYLVPMLAQPFEAMTGSHGAKSATKLYRRERSFLGPCLGKIKDGEAEKEESLWLKVLGKKLHFAILRPTKQRPMNNLITTPPTR